ncbi:hypothetical protein M0R45_018475 [Rubus argutus]|uniref:Uncharacterized protein n=1 Tax=Rubus argutus TaxID=59490 RepID=A0AAW1X2P5_RUBAR
METKTKQVAPRLNRSREETGTINKGEKHNKAENCRNAFAEGKEGHEHHHSLAQQPSLHEMELTNKIGDPPVEKSETVEQSRDMFIHQLIWLLGAAGTHVESTLVGCVCGSICAAGTRVKFTFEGYQFDYVFDRAILKYPQIGSSSGALASAKPTLNPGPSVERTERPSVGQDFRDRFPGAVEAFSRRNGSGHGLPGDTSRHRSTDNAPSSKDVQPDSERTHSSSRNYVVRDVTKNAGATLSSSRVNLSFSVKEEELVSFSSGRSFSPSMVSGMQWRPGRSFPNQNKAVLFCGRTELAPNQGEKFLQRLQQVQQQDQCIIVSMPTLAVGNSKQFPVK